MSEEQKPQSENPFEYGDKYFKRLSGDAKETTEQVIAVVGDLVCFGKGPHSWEWMHYKRLQETLAIEKWEKIYPRKWEEK